MHKYLALIILMASTASASTLIVNDDGSGNFTRIQDAINTSAEGDEIIVRGGPYQERLVVDRSIMLRGDGYPVVYGCDTGEPVIKITAANVTVEGFMISNCTNEMCMSGAVEVRSDGCKLLNNTIFNNTGHGVYLFKSDNHVISGNRIHDNGYLNIRTLDSDYNEISGNEIYRGGKSGILVENSEFSALTKNDVYENVETGICLHKSEDCIILNNNIEHAQ